MGLRDTIQTLMPATMRDGVFERINMALGLMSDALLEKLTQATHAHMPGKANPDALPYIGQDRLVPQGLTESTASYAARLQTALDDWPRAGGPWGLLRSTLGAVLAAQPAARAVSTKYASTPTPLSTWSSYAEAADTTKPPTFFAAGTTNFDWDSLSAFYQGALGWWRHWLVFYAGTSPVGGAITAATNATPIAITTTVAHGLSTGAAVYVDQAGGNIAANGQWSVTVTGANTLTLNGSTGSGAWTSGGVIYAIGGQAWIAPAPVWGQSGVTWGDTSKSFGFNAPPAVIAGIRTVAALRKSGWLHEIIVSFDPTIFDPAQPSGGGINPDGTCGSWSKIVHGQYVPSRPTGARYCDGV